MAIIVQKVYHKCKIWLLFAIISTGASNCTKEHEAQQVPLPRTWLKEKAEIEKYSKVDSSKAFQLLSQFHKKFPNSAYKDAFYHIGIAETYRYWYKNERALQHAYQAIDFSKLANYTEGQILGYLIIAETNTKCESCLDFLLKIERIVKSGRYKVSPSTLFRFYYDMGFYYYEIGDYKAAKKYFLQALGHAKKEQLLYDESMVLLAFSSTYNREENFEESIKYSAQSIQKCNSFNPKECGNHYYQYATSLLELKRYDEALKAILEAKKLYKMHPHPFNPGEIEGILGTIYLKQKKYKEAEKSYLTFFENARFASTKIWAHNLLTNFYFDIGDFKNAYLNSRRYIKLRDSIYSNERTYTSIAKRTDFELSLKEEEVHEAKIRLWYAISIGGAILILGLSLGFLSYRNYKLKTQLANVKQEKLQQQVDFEQRKLATTTLHLSQQSDVLRNIKTDIERLNENADALLKGKIKTILKTIDNNVVSDEDEWDKFKLHFEAVSPHFFETLRQKSSILTELDLKHCAYIKINLSPKQVAQILGISPKSVTLSRVRIKKKLQLDESESLNSFLQNI